MLRTLDATSEAFVTNMQQIGQRMDRAQRQLSTGLRVSTIYDEPDTVSTLLQARADLSSTEQIQSNLSRVKAETDSGEGALTSAVSFVERARMLGAEGATSTATPGSRQALATEVGSILDELVGISRTSVEGRYIFSGDSDQTAPYSIDLNATTPVSSYAGGAATRQIQHPNGTRFSVGKTAQEIFDSPDPAQNVFASLNSLRTALQSNNQAAISAALPKVIGSLDHLNSELAYYGTVQNKVAAATQFGATLKLQLTTHVSSLQDADITQSIMELTQSQLQQTAALQAQAKIPRTSLFNFLA